MDAEFVEAARRAVYTLKAASDCLMLIQTETDDLALVMSEWLAREARELEEMVAAAAG